MDLTYESVARNILQQEDSIGYAVFDQQVRSVPGYEHAIGTDVDPIQADSIEGLEALIGLPAGSLVRTVAEFNAACGTERRSTGAGSTASPPPSGRAAGEIATGPGHSPTGPFFAYPQICANVFTFGGVKTDLAARVVTSDGHPISGLYGAGEMTGLYYEAYAGSTSVMRSITFGRVAGAMRRGWPPPHPCGPSRSIPSSMSGQTAGMVQRPRPFARFCVRGDRAAYSAVSSVGRCWVADRISAPRVETRGNTGR